MSNDGALPALLTKDSNKPMSADKEIGLASLPFDVLRNITLSIGPLSTQRLAQVSSRLYKLLKDDSIWIGLAQGAMSDARVLVFDTMPNAAAQVTSTIKWALIRTDKLNEAWGIRETGQCRPLVHKEKRLDCGSPNRFDYDTKTMPDRLIIVPCSTDFLDETFLFGSYRSLRRGGYDHLIYPYYREGTHFVTLSRLQQSLTESESQSIFRTSTRLCPLSLENDKGQPGRHVFQSVTTKLLPFHLLDQVVDSSNGRTFALFTRYDEPRVLKVVVVLDWKSSASIIFNTGLHCKHKGVTSSIHLSHDGSRLDVCTDDARYWAHASFHLEDLLKSENVMSLAETLAPSPKDVEIAPATTSFALFEPWSDPLMRRTNPALYNHYTFPQPRQTPVGEPAFFSYVRLYSRGSHGALFGYYLRLTQFYADERGPGPRSLLTLQNLAPWGEDLFSVSFSHVAWVGTVFRNHGNRGRQKMQRTLKVAAFPPPGSAQSNPAELTPVQLDIPHSCLEKALNIYLEPALASVFILCKGNRLHKFQFA